MSSLLHSLHIGTLATWLSVIGFGTAGILLPNRATPREPRQEMLETSWVPEDFTVGGETSPPATEPPPATDTSEPAEPLPAPPDMPDLTELAPLPEVPEVPESPPPAPAAITQMSPTPRHHAAVETMRRPSRPATGNPATAGGSPATGGRPGGGPGGGSGMSNAARLAAGSMPSPAYPAEARRLGQTGTLVVEFTIDASGRVISAHAKSPSPWPLLNQEAVRAVRRWRFPPGPVMTLQRPIVFQLR